MTILYSWRKILNASKGKVRHIITIFDMIVFNRSPRSKNDARMLFINKEFSGNSFMLNPEDLLEYKNFYTLKEIAQYIALASYRNYAEYQITGNLRLKLIRSPVGINLIKKNRLLSIEGDEIVFLYEEVKRRI